MFLIFYRFFRKFLKMVDSLLAAYGSSQNCQLSFVDTDEEFQVFKYFFLFKLGVL